MASEDLLSRARQMSNDITIGDYIDDGMPDDAVHLIKACGRMINELADELENHMPSPVVEQPQVTTMNFYDALRRVVDGEQITRQSWPPANAVFLHNGLLYLRKADGSLHTLIVSDGDLRGTDWVITHDN